MFRSIHRACCPLTCGVSLPSLPAAGEPEYACSRRFRTRPPPVSVSLPAVAECGLETALRGGGVPAGWIGGRRLAGCSHPAAQRGLRRGRRIPKKGRAALQIRATQEKEGAGKGRGRKKTSELSSAWEKAWRDKARGRSAPSDLGECHDEPARDGSRAVGHLEVGRFGRQVESCDGLRGGVVLDRGLAHAECAVLGARREARLPFLRERRVHPSDGEDRFLGLHGSAFRVPQEVGELPLPEHVADVGLRIRRRDRRSLVPVPRHVIDPAEVPVRGVRIGGVV